MNGKLKGVIEESVNAGAFVLCVQGVVLGIAFVMSIVVDLFRSYTLPTIPMVLMAPAAFVIAFAVQTFDLVFKKGKK